MSFLDKLFYLLACHALTDYVLQPEWMARHKSPLTPPPEELGEWWWALAAHGLVNGLAVALITQHVYVGVAETFVHAYADRKKCLREWSVKTDQLVHLLSKLCWAAIP